MPATRKDSQVSVRLPNDLKDMMEVYAQLTGRTKSHVAMEALSVYLDERIPQIEDLQQAVQAADRGEFASDAEVAVVRAKYSQPQPSMRPAKAKARPRLA